MAYPVTFDIQPPERFERPHVFVRILIIVILALIGGVLGWLWGAVYLVFPVAAAILISQKGAERFLAESESNLTKWLRYLIALYAYMGFLTDRFINEEPTETLQLSVRPGGRPTAGEALLRIILGIPHALVLGIIGIAFIVVLPVAAISILMNETYPSWAYNFTRGWLRWSTRLLAYMSSLVEEYPPFSFSNGAEPAPAAAAGAPPAEPAPSELPPTEPSGGEASPGETRSQPGDEQTS